VATLLLAKVVKTSQGVFGVIKGVGDSSVFVQRADGSIERVPVPKDSWLAREVGRRTITEGEAEWISQAESYGGFLLTLRQASRVSDRALGNLQRPEHFGRDGLVRLAENDREVRRVFLLLETFKNYWGVKGGRVTQMLALQEAVRPHTAVVRLSSDDRLFLLGDGVENLTDKEIARVLQGADGSVEDAARALVGEAKARSALSRAENFRAHKDDITAVGLRVMERGAGAEGGAGGGNRTSDKTGAGAGRLRPWLDRRELALYNREC
jgi:serine/threonine protein phosphatase PrpC